ncbi:nicotinate-nucleotide-dimethylbenzimidazole phosphoribosyltransferase [Roseovarius nanhaiticus]|uniref:Nicotinate-nucleotide--dimethylbenzimidazole phosphoribosyltransferase n=1 Tax=Roseovarius nanhaiticus TaxID=573024 RepID=A0A1N7HDD7_9RHOB|nr:nicotinate-nucleotide--dimethylbenzimidazole phosphoribosyltransferase [Roseovarius nanhaiticus]SEL01700.1 nicotinate-nucleotide-dimethylbenzimidazole phosphoribosyltransferase [Roseovarius nanhaiticus]SIS22783.1 nicotinate-nucleotide-dimethylbenzimidazole phosphoribosyltransferase [Roseovarius nanhaiticus]
MRRDLKTMTDLAALLADLPEPDTGALEAARGRNNALTKPPRALGRLEDVAAWYCGWRGDARAQVSAPQVIVFAGNHGVTAQGVSAFPAEVTAQMVANFKAGGAAINQLARLVGARLDVHAIELDRPTVDFTRAAAMDEAEFMDALRTGWDAVDPATDLLVTGEMGIGNTTSASAICNALYGGQAIDWTGKGTGVDAEAMAVKARVVGEGVRRHDALRRAPLQVLRALGGRELAAMAGAILRARHLRIPVILDGFICCAAAACLEGAARGALDHCVAGHVSAEAAHPRLLHHLNKAPLLSLGMRLGEGTGAALAIGIVQGALACHSGMATFEEAGVSSG